MNYIKEKDRDKGFTLIELVIVIAIIGNMASVVVLSIGDLTGGAEDAKDIAQAAQLKTAVFLYSSSNGGDFTGLCANKINNEPVFKTLGDENNTKRICLDHTNEWVIIWKKKQGDNYSCIGNLGDIKEYATVGTSASIRYNSRFCSRVYERIGVNRVNAIIFREFFP